MAHKSHELRPVTDPPSGMPDGRGGRQYTLPRVLMKDIASGTRSIFLRFKAAIKTAEAANFQHSDYNLPKDEMDAAYADADRQEQAMLRALVRLQNKGPEDVEALKRDLKKACDVIYAVTQSPENAMDIIVASKVSTLVVKVKYGRQRHAYADGIAAFQKLLLDGRKK